MSLSFKASCPAISIFIVFLHFQLTSITLSAPHHQHSGHHGELNRHREFQHHNVRHEEPHRHREFDRSRGLRRFERQPGFGIHRNRDGGFTESFSVANAINLPGASSAFGLTENINVGPGGISFSDSESSSFNSPLGGFSQADALSSSFGQGGSSFANANAASVSNPIFQSSFANANANSFSNNRLLSPFIRRNI